MSKDKIQEKSCGFRKINQGPTFKQRGLILERQEKKKIRDSESKRER